jgi:hypothetical protein
VTTRKSNCKRFDKGVAYWLRLFTLPQSYMALRVSHW